MTHDASHPDDAAVASALVTATAGTFSAPILNAAMRDTGTSRRQLAASLGVSKSRVDGWCDGRQTLTIDAIGRMPPGIASHIIGQMQAKNEARRYKRPSLSPGKHVSIAASALGEVARVVIEAEADGTIDADESHAIGRAYYLLSESAKRAAEDVGARQ